MKEIQLSRGFVAKVDDADYHDLSRHSWKAVRPNRKSGKWYAARTSEGGRGLVYMHRLLLGFPPCQVDHRDGDGLNNQRLNLRKATPTQNLQNRGSVPGTSSAFKGVSLYRAGGKWSAQIKVDGRKKHLGYFDDEVAAARAYDAVAAVQFGEFARLNFPGENR